ncbi:hypothetical protein [Rhodopirellula bahusiensis]|uniref:Uncharacterized protein n=1 Tax=Rhodopirellula bahusiensis TaxID=2014065 RepID=A0A2G1WDD7_9BACT|nr:hypothetical protein [Rhodopirellula bahusiensis]PHQ37038.1 hypothetical protein CEE69_01310 [Rhodopirellula bahusiensis]
MVKLAGEQSSPTVNRVASELDHAKTDVSRFDRATLTFDELSKPRQAIDLASELWSRLPFSRAGAASGDRGIEHTIRIVTTSTSQIQEWYRELNDFVPAIAKAAIEFRGDELTAELHGELAAEIERQMVEQVRYPTPSRSFVDFKYADLSPAEAWAEGRLRLEEACLRFANDVLALFDSLQQEHLIGQIQEASTTCRFTYFRRVAVVELAETRTRERVVDESGRRMFQDSYLVETLQVSDYEIQHRQAQHVHHVRQPTLNEPSATVHPLPTKYNELIESCPDWLHGQLRVLEGELFRHECIEWDLLTETRSAEKVIERVRRDPAVLIGPYVLAGWGEDTIKAEENRQLDTRIAAARKKAASAALINHILSYGLATLAVAVVAVSAPAIATLTSLGILLGLAAMGFAGNAAHLASIANSVVSAKSVLLHSALIGASVFAIQGFVFSILYWSLPAFVIGAIAAIVAATALKAHRAATELDESSVG